MNGKTALELLEYWIEQYYRINGTPTLDDIKGQINLLKDYEREQLHIADVISRLKIKLEVNAGRIAEPLLKAGKNPKDDENCHKAFLMLAHLEAIEDYINSL